MAEIGLILVGPAACRLRGDVEDGVEAIAVRADEIAPLDSDLEAMVGYAADGTFHGPDADRWRVLSVEQLRTETGVLWACAQVQAAGLHQATSAWDKVLVVGWADEAGLAPAVRALVRGDRPLTVLMGGDLESGDLAHVQANLVVLAQLVRKGQVTTVVHNPRPEDVLDVALDAARHPDPIRVPRPRPLDLGPSLDQPSTWCMPSPPVHFYSLVHVPMGYAHRLSELAVLVAARRSVLDLVLGPPVDVPGVRSDWDATVSASAAVPDHDVPSRYRQQIVDALGGIEFEGSEPLVEQIDRQLRPVVASIRQVIDQLAAVERRRLEPLRAFSAVGIRYAVQNLSGRLDAVHEAYPSAHLRALDDLLGGKGRPPQAGAVHLTAWRRAFAGLSSQVAQRGTPGWRVARSLVEERFEQFRSELASAAAAHLEVLVRRARDAEAPPSTDELRSLRDRAERVQICLEDAVRHLEERIEAEAHEAIRNDRIVRWAAPEPRSLLRQLTTRIHALPSAGVLDHLASDVLSRRPLGMADERDFERYLGELSRAVHDLPDAVAHPPSYEDVLLLLLQGRDPPVLRQAIAQSQGAEVELLLERTVAPALMNWFTATGMLVVVSPRLKTCAIYWQRMESAGSMAGERLRRATSEHRLADLMLAGPGGDSVGDLVSVVRAAVYLVVGLVVGALVVQRHEGQQVHALVGVEMGLPELVLLPHGGLHLFAHEPQLRARLRQRLAERLHALPLRADAVETVRKLVELATLGPSSTLSAQLGLFGARFDHLEQPVHALLQNYANLAVAAMMDCLHTSELEQLTRRPRRRTLVDVVQLGPSGVP